MPAGRSFAVLFAQGDQRRIDKRGEDMEQMIVRHAHAAEDGDDEEKEDTLCRRAPENKDKPLHDMKGIGEYAEDTAAGEHLDICIVIHIGEQPVFDII